MLEAVQQRLDMNPQAMRMRRETAEHPFGTLKVRMGATQFLMKTLLSHPEPPMSDAMPWWGRRIS